jgi:hypothetical protein
MRNSTAAGASVAGSAARLFADYLIEALKSG